MNLIFFIASKLIKQKHSSQKLSAPIVKIAIVSTALGMSVMLAAILIVTGFKNQIRDKVIGFSAHIHVNHYDSNQSFEPYPISKDELDTSLALQIKGIKHIQAYGLKPGIIKTGDEIEGVVVKGVDTNFDISFFQDKIIEGRFIELIDSVRVNEIVISEQVAKKLQLQVNDDLLMYFIQDPPRMRKFKITGIYRTGLEDFDKLYVWSDIKHIQRLNDWDESYVSGFEIFVDKIENIYDIKYHLEEILGYNVKTASVTELYPQIFDWLNLQDVNVTVIITLIIIVAGINLIATLLVIILEKTGHIGILKTLGMPNKSIRNIFITVGAYVTAKGLLWGNVIGLGICFLQYQFGFIKLDETNYYLSQVPISFDWTAIILLNLGTLFISTVMMIIPSLIISRVSPIKAIRFK